MSRRGRPRADRVALAEQIATLLRAEPELSANDVVRRVGARRGDVLRLVAALKTLATAESIHSVEGANGWFPNAQNGPHEGAS